MGTIETGNLRQISNFGGNVAWYSRYYAPASESEILDILRQHRGVTVRVIGSGHSWSSIAAQSDIVLDLGALSSVLTVKSGDEELVRVGAGCTLQRLLDQLHAATDRTLPTLGAIKKQTIAGAISTGTHGSGRASLSHYVAGVRAIVFDPVTKDPVVREFAEGDELRAMRCGLGCTGIILSVDLHTVPKYWVAETVRTYQTIEDILPAFAEYPLTNFTLSPYGWKFMVFERKPLAERRRACCRESRRWPTGSTTSSFSTSIFTWELSQQD